MNKINTIYGFIMRRMKLAGTAALLLSIISINYTTVHAADSTGIQNTIAPDSITIVTDSVCPSSRQMIKGADSNLPILQDTLVTDTTIITLDSLSFPADTLADTLCLVMVGDVMLGTDYPGPEYLPPGNDCWPLLSPFADKISNADIAFCNLEGGFAGPQGIAKICKDPKTCYVFRVPDEYVSCLSSAGFDVVSVANNHVNDFGYAGQINTVEVLTNAGIHFAGFSEYPYSIFESNGLRIGFCAFSTNRGVQSMLDISNAERIVSFLNDTCDIVLVSVHGGAEGSQYQHVTRQRETFLGADRGNIYSFAHSMIDAGADIIIGHGPHVTRAMEVYNDRFIAYSLGNFATYARFNLSGPNGIAPLVTIWTDREGKFLKGEIIPVRQTGEGGAQPDPERRVIFKLQELIATDFPDNPLTIDNEGNISK